MPAGCQFPERVGNRSIVDRIFNPIASETSLFCEAHLDIQCDCLFLDLLVRINADARRNPQILDDDTVTGKRFRG